MQTHCHNTCASPSDKMSIGNRLMTGLLQSSLIPCIQHAIKNYHSLVQVSRPLECLFGRSRGCALQKIVRWFLSRCDFNVFSAFIFRFYSDFSNIIFFFNFHIINIYFLVVRNYSENEAKLRSKD